MKILHLLSQHPESTGSGVYLQNILRQAAGTGHENYLLAGWSGLLPPRLDVIPPQNCRYVHFETEQLDFKIPGMSDIMPYPSSRFSALTPAQLERYQRCFAEAITRVAADFGPDIIHSHHLWLVSAVARETLPDLPMVTSCHATGLRQFMQCSQLRQRVRQGCRKIDRVLALSAYQAEQIQGCYGIASDRIDVVGGGLDEQLFRFKEKTAAAPVKILYAGKFSYAKGLDCLLRVFLRFPDEQLQLYLAGSGTGPEAQRCLELAQQNTRRITVLGKLSQWQLAQQMADAHLLVLPSFYEGLPLVLLEALACGCRLVSTDLPGCQELLQGIDPDLVERLPLPRLAQIDRPDEADLPGFEAGLQRAIQALVERIRRAPTPSAETVAAAIEPFRWQKVFQRINNSYRRVLGD